MVTTISFEFPRYRVGAHALTFAKTAAKVLLFFDMTKYFC